MKSQCQCIFETFFEVPDFLDFDGEDYMYYEEDPQLEEVARDIKAKWSGFQAAWKYNKTEE